LERVLFLGPVLLGMLPILRSAGQPLWVTALVAIAGQVAQTRDTFNLKAPSGLQSMVIYAF